MTQMVSDGIQLARATGHRVLDGVGTAADGVRQEVRGAREHFTASASSSERRTVRNRIAAAAALAAGVLTAGYAAGVVRKLVRMRRK